MSLTLAQALGQSSAPARLMFLDRIHVPGQRQFEVQHPDPTLPMSLAQIHVSGQPQHPDLTLPMSLAQIHVSGQP
jgi:hypothetical protein